MRVPRVPLRWRVQTFLVALPIIAILLWFYAEASRSTDVLREDAIRQIASHARMEKSYRDQAGRLGKQAAACLEQATKVQSPEEKATWSEKAARHLGEARKALEIAERSVPEIGVGDEITIKIIETDQVSPEDERFRADMSRFRPDKDRVQRVVELNCRPGMGRNRAKSGEILQKPPSGESGPNV
jgi:hypothetical protein